MTSDPQEWDEAYVKGDDHWTVEHLSPIVRDYLSQYTSPDLRILEVGCGKGFESGEIAALGYQVHGLDISSKAIQQALSLHSNTHNSTFETGDFLNWNPNYCFDVIYDRGFFHNANGIEERSEIARKVSSLLKPNGVWINVSGAADSDTSDIRAGGAIFATDLVVACEPYFAISRIQRGRYYPTHSANKYQAFFSILEKRGPHHF